MSQILKKTGDEFVANTKQKVLDEIEQIVYFGLAKKDPVDQHPPKYVRLPHIIFIIYSNDFIWCCLSLQSCCKVLPEKFSFDMFCIPILWELGNATPDSTGLEKHKFIVTKFF